MIMKLFGNYFNLALILAGLAAMPVVAKPVVLQPTNSIAPRSVFILPSNPKEGRDPFFPSSMRPYISAVPKAVPGGDITALRLIGVSGAPGHRLVIINNHTFGVGDEGEVITSQGRMHIRCVDITANSVVIEADGRRAELHYSSEP